MLSITSLFGFDDSPRINRTLLYKDLKVSDLQEGKAEQKKKHNCI